MFHSNAERTSDLTNLYLEPSERNSQFSYITLWDENHSRRFQVNDSNIAVSQTQQPDENRFTIYDNNGQGTEFRFPNNFDQLLRHSRALIGPNGQIDIIINIGNQHLKIPLLSNSPAQNQSIKLEALPVWNAIFGIKKEEGSSRAARVLLKHLLKNEQISMPPQLPSSNLELFMERTKTKVRQTIKQVQNWYQKITGQTPQGYQESLMHPERRLKHPRFGAITDPGNTRQINEDTLWFSTHLPEELTQERGQLYLVADGMGGHSAGEVASALATQVVSAMYYGNHTGDVANTLENAIQAANEVILTAAETQLEQQGMGTTLVASVIHNNELITANIGDSRAYLIRANLIEQITTDHTFSQQLLESGLSELAQSPTHKATLVRALGDKIEAKIDIYRQQLMAGDTVLLCSDGLSDLINDEEIQEIVFTDYPNQPQKACQTLVQLAKKRGAPDNVTALLFTHRPEDFVD